MFLSISPTLFPASYFSICRVFCTFVASYAKPLCLTSNFESMSKKVTYCAGFRSHGGVLTEKTGLDFLEAIEFIDGIKKTGVEDVWIYYDPFPAWR